MKKNISLISVILLVLIIFSFGCQRSEEKDPDVIKTIKAGVLEWTAQNLDVSSFRNGDPIPEAKTEEQWKKAAMEGTPAWCYYNNDPANGKKYGKLYNWYALNDPRGLCPEGWHIPDYEEWNSFNRLLGKDAGNKLKSVSGWKDNGNGTDSIGFSALPAGVRYHSGMFNDLGRYAHFRTSEIKGPWYSYLSYNESTLGFIKYLEISKGRGMSVRCVRRILYNDYEINPPDPPNDGIMFVDHEAKLRSGHYGNALTECKNGDILAFYTNVSGKIYDGHGQAGWTEYKRSGDGGKTWSQPVIFEYSKKVWDENKLTADSVPEGSFYNAAYVASAITAPNGNLIAILTRRQANEQGIIGHLTPVYMISNDNGHSWNGPEQIDKTATVDELAVTHNDGASFVHDGVIYVVFIRGQFGNGEHSLYVSEDNGESFKKRSGGFFIKRPYKDNFYYMTAKVLDGGRFIIYTFNSEDEHNLPYVISGDRGYTWSEVRSTYLEKRIRNPQLSYKIGDYYFMHGRSGLGGYDPGCLVLYASKDGINWDRGIFLNKVQQGLDSYSANEVIGKYDPDTPDRLLIQSSISYSGYGRVNIKHWWIENIPGSR